MGQTWTADVYAASHAAATDLQNIETNFLTLHSTFSGTTAPGNTEAGLQWMDTSKKVCKLRNDDDSAWWGLMHGDSSQKILVYRNAAMDGWIVDSGSTDRVIALKGGSTYTTGGQEAGSWTLSGITNANENSHTHGTNNPGNHTHSQFAGSGGYGPAGGSDSNATGGGGGHTHTTNSADNHTHAISSDATWRIAAAVVTLQYLDL
jgi:hypothetical protein